MKEKINYKTVLVSAGVSLLMCVIVACGVISFVINRDKSTSPEDVTYAEGDTLPSGAEVNDTKGGTASLTLTDGTVVEYTIPKQLYSVREDYLALVKQAYGLQNNVTSDNLIVAGNDNNVFSSTSAITATTFTDTYNIYAQIYGDEWADIDMSEIYPPVYQYILDGEVPETPYTNYSINEIDSITKDNITYRVFEQDYDIVSEAVEGVEETAPDEHVHQIVAYSDTEDVIEIIVDEENNSTNAAVKMLKEFIGV